MERIVAFDIGRSKTGVAVSDPLGITARGVSVVDMNDPECIKFLSDIILKYKARKVVVGIPVRTDGKEGKEVDFVRGVIRKIKGILPDVEFIEIDERFTTVLSKRYLRDCGYKEKKSKKFVDVLSAEILLSEYLKRQKGDV